MKRGDKVTRQWVRNRSDELAIEAGYRFDEERAAHVCEFFATELRLYEGDGFAGEPFQLMEWQVDLLSRAFGWVHYSDDWSREVRRFRKVSVWVPKKNGKSPLAAGVGLYLLAADGEPGQKVFSAARDGRQARIVHTHAQQMAMRSPSLRNLVTINRSTGRIAVEDTVSFYDVMSSDNVQGQEGLNGSVIIDETHVVDDKLVKVLEYMGASRSEPMQFEVSTAGNNPDGYGKRQWQYGRQVESGAVTDHQFLFVFYGVEESTSDKDCMDPKTWQAANPSWGVTIKPSEFEQAAKTARSKSISDWKTFCMYRLNQWQAGANPWLDRQQWLDCRRPFELADVQDLPCSVGMDLSKTRDMSALAACWQEGETTWLKVWLWITEAYADKFSDKAPFADWAASGQLHVIPGDVIRQRYIREQFSELVEEMDVQVLVYDKTYAQEFTEWVEETYSVELVEFPQSSALMEKPIDDFEAAVRLGRIQHDGNPCLTWQAGHCEIKPNFKGHRLLCKPSKDDVRKIDGMVASVMGLWGTQHLEESITGASFLYL